MGLASRRFGLSALLVVLWTFGACRSSAPPTQQNLPTSNERLIGQRGGSLTYRVIAPPQTFNYLIAADEPSLLVAFYLLGGRLVEFDHDARAYVPGLAASWKLNNDGRTVEVTLRDDAKFSDGHVLTAEDVGF